MHCRRAGTFPPERDSIHYLRWLLWPGACLRVHRESRRPRLGVTTGWIVMLIGTAQLLFALILLMAFYAGCVHLRRGFVCFVPIPRQRGTGAAVPLHE